MIDRRDDPSLTPKSFGGVGIKNQSVRKKFQSDEASEFKVFSLVDIAHSPASDLLQDTKMRDMTSEHKLFWSGV
jgi:hypothetical protein